MLTYFFRTNTTSALWRARLELRRLRFQELTEEGRSHEALAYLQTHLYQATDHSDPEQERQVYKNNNLFKLAFD